MNIIPIFTALISFIGIISLSYAVDIKSDVFLAGETIVEGVTDSKSRYGQFREPGVVATNSGRLVVVCQARDHSKWSDRSGQDLVARYSDDQGKSWSNATLLDEQGNDSICPNSVVYDAEKDTLHVLYNVFGWDFTIGHKGYKKLKQEKKLQREGCKQYQVSSHDGGKTWSKPRDISGQIKADGAITVFGSGRGIQLKHKKHKGRLLITGCARHPKWGNHSFYSDDHGQTWQRGDYAPVSPAAKKMNVRNECKAAELPDGRLILNCRSMPYRTRAWSNDGGVTWSAIEPDPELPMASSNAAIISHRHKGVDYLIFAGPVGPGRTNGMVLLSDDGGKTWPHRKMILKETVAYTSLASMQNGQVALAYETEVYHGGSYKHIRLVTFGLDEILGEHDSFPRNRADKNKGTYENP